MFNRVFLVPLAETLYIVESIEGRINIDIFSSLELIILGQELNIIAFN